MDQVITPSATYFLSQGTLGVIVVVLACVCAYLYRKAEKTIENHVKDIKEMAEQGKTDILSATEKIREPIDKMAKAVESTQELVRVLVNRGNS